MANYPQSQFCRLDRQGIIGALILGFGRAVGETVAVANLSEEHRTRQPPKVRFFQTGETIASKIANSYGEAADPISFLGYHRTRLSACSSSP